MITGTLKFWNLGRSKAKGEIKISAQTIEEFNDKILAEFSKYLMSSDISFDNGKVYAGFHKVGDYLVTSQEVTLEG